MTTFHGSCHCGRVQFEVDATPTRLSECNCSICSKKGALYVPIPEIQALRIVAGESELTTYQFNTKSAKHYFCKHCGIHTFHRPRVDPSRWSVNARCLADIDMSALPVTQFDGQNWEATVRAAGGSSKTDSENNN